MSGITKRKDGRFCATVQLGQIRRFVYGRTPQEVKRKLRGLQAVATLTGNLPTSTKLSLSEFIDQWLTAAGPNLKPRTLSDYRRLADSHVLPSLGKLKFSRLQPRHLQNIYAYLQSQGLKRAPAQVHALLHRALNIACKWSLLTENPADRVIKPAYRAERKQVWSAEQANIFLEGSKGQRLWPLWCLAAYSGCRLGELLGLRWEDVDLQAGSIWVRRNLQRIKGQWVESTPKTESGERTIALPCQAMQALERQDAHVAAMKLKGGLSFADKGLVFCGQHGQPLSSSYLSLTLKRQCQKLGLTPLTHHHLRHLHASLLLANGVALTDVSQRLGHANPAITASIYSHALPGREGQIVQVLEKNFAR